MQEDPIQEKSLLFDKPLECTSCNDPVTVHYTEISLSDRKTYGLCDHCPCLKMRLEEDTPYTQKEAADIACSNCHTTRTSILRGGPMGCSACYDLFAALLQSEVLSEAQSHYNGKHPKEKSPHSPSAHLYSLNQALNETLSKEEYERAAQIRDQINRLIKKSQ